MTAFVKIRFRLLTGLSNYKANSIVTWQFIYNNYMIMTKEEVKKLSVLTAKKVSMKISDIITCTGGSCAC